MPYDALVISGSEKKKKIIHAVFSTTVEINM